MNDVIMIHTQPHAIQIKEYKGQRVVTFKDIDTLHQRPDGTAGRNFRENRNRFIEGEDYFVVKPGDIQSDEIRRSEINNRGTTLLTQFGYLMLVKSFNDDLAWSIQRQLVNNYFQSKVQPERKHQRVVMSDSRIYRPVEELALCDNLDFTLAESQWVYLTASDISEKLLNDKKYARNIGKILVSQYGYLPKKSEMLRHFRILNGIKQYFVPLVQA